MSKFKPPKVGPEIEQALEGLDWYWENGKRHWKIMVGLDMLSVVSHGPKPTKHYDRMTLQNIIRWRKEKGI
jgi:hypothetical protein